MYSVLSRSEIRKKENEYMNSNGVAERDLINIAAERLFEIVKQRINEVTKILVVAGKGNNGEDGRALFSLLKNGGFCADLFDTAESDADKFDFDSYGLIVDALFGIGLNAEIKGSLLDVINKINASGAVKLSVDIPSGLDADSGLVLGVCVKADITVTFVAPKTGMILNDGRDFCGEIITADIGVPVPENAVKVIEKKDVFIEKRKINSHKGDYGRVKIVAGSLEMPGAAVLSLLSAKACLRSGAGLTVLAVPESMSDAYASRSLESTLFFLSDNNGKVVFNESEVKELVKNADSVVIGMGMGFNPEIIKFLTYFLSLDINLVIDADGLNNLRGNLAILNNKRANVIMTPHLAEFCRLTELEIETLKQNLIKNAEEFAKKYGITLILKGASSIITEGASTYINVSGTPALAKGGSGDLLSGITGALACRFDTLTAAKYASFILGEAAENAGKDFGENSLLSSDIVDYINF